MKDFKILVCGGRDLDPNKVADALESQACKEFWDEGVIIIHGCAKGADTGADIFAERVGIQVWSYPANWRKYGNRAGPIRNKQMLDAGPDIVIAFPGGSGTKHMVDIAEKAGIKVIRIDGDFN